MSVLFQARRLPIQRQSSANNSDSRDHDVEKGLDTKSKVEVEGSVPHPEASKSLLGKFTKTAKKLYKTFGINHFVPLFVVAVYTLIGAGLFQSIEYHNDSEFLKRRYDNYTGNKEEVIKKIYELGQMHSMLNETENYNKIIETLNHFETINNFSVSNNSKWDFWNAMYFAGTIYTTIGM